MSGKLKSNLVEHLAGGKTVRGLHLANRIRILIPHQIRALRESRNWTQKELADRAGKSQAVISRLENPAYASFTLKTLLELAEALDVALLVKYVSYNRFLNEFKNLDSESLAPVSFEEEVFEPARDTLSTSSGDRRYVDDVAPGDNRMIQASSPPGPPASVVDLGLSQMATTSGGSNDGRISRTG